MTANNVINAGAKLDWRQTLRTRATSGFAKRGVIGTFGGAKADPFVGLNLRTSQTARVKR